MIREKWYIFTVGSFICCSLNYIFILYALFAYILMFKQYYTGYSHIFWIIILFLWAGMGIWSHLKCMLDDPVYKKNYFREYYHIYLKKKSKIIDKIQKM